MRTVSAFIFFLLSLAGTALADGLADPGVAGAQVAGPSLFRMLLPLIFIGLLVYVGLRMFRRGRGPGQGGGANRPRPKDYSRPDDPENMRDAYQRARASWDWLSQGPTQGEDVEAGPAIPVPDAPMGFDPEEFVAGAKAAYVRIRHALATGEREDAEFFAEPGPLDDLVGSSDPGALPSEFLLVNARLMGVEAEDGLTRATVFYDVLARVEGAEEPVQLREVWKFSRREDDSGSHWKLFGVESMDQGPPQDGEPVETMGGPQ
jgi:predicted lipid-binding transport protein (Tim44 family)